MAAPARLGGPALEQNVPWVSAWGQCNAKEKKGGHYWPPCIITPYRQFPPPPRNSKNHQNLAAKSRIAGVPADATPVGWVVGVQVVPAGGGGQTVATAGQVVC